MKNNKRRKETHKGHCLIFQGRYDISFLRVVFESFDVHLSLIHKKRPQHKANEAKQGEFINNISNYPKTIGALFKSWTASFYLYNGEPRSHTSKKKKRICDARIECLYTYIDLSIKQ